MTRCCVCFASKIIFLNMTHWFVFIIRKSRDYVYAIPHNPIPINSLWGLVPSLPWLAVASPGAGCGAFVGLRSSWCMSLGLPGHTVKGHHQATFLVVHPTDQGIGCSHYWRLKNNFNWMHLTFVNVHTENDVKITAIWYMTKSVKYRCTFLFSYMFV